MKACSCIR